MEEIIPEFAPTTGAEPDTQAPEPAVMLADIDNLDPADVLAELPY